MESEAMSGLGSISAGGNILSLDFFHEVRASDVNINLYRSAGRTRETIHPQGTANILDKRPQHSNFLRIFSKYILKCSAKIGIISQNLTVRNFNSLNSRI